MSAHRGKSSTAPSSPNPLYLTFDADPDTPVYEVVRVTLANRKTTVGRACENCGRVIAIGSRGSLHAFETHKSACKGPPTTSHPIKLGDRTRSMSATSPTMSLSPLMVPPPGLSQSLPGDPTSPPHSPLFGFIRSPFDITSPNSGDCGALADPAPFRPVFPVMVSGESLLRVNDGFFYARAC